MVRRGLVSYRGTADPAVVQPCVQGNMRQTPMLWQLVLHIGNDFDKDYIGATNAGFQAVLIDRFKNGEGEEWAQNGAPVFSDLIDVVEYFAREGFIGPNDNEQ